MAAKVGVIRDGDNLADAIHRIDAIERGADQHHDAQHGDRRTARRDCGLAAAREPRRAFPLGLSGRR